MNHSQSWFLFVFTRNHVFTHCLYSVTVTCNAFFLRWVYSSSKNRFHCALSTSRTHEHLRIICSFMSSLYLDDIYSNLCLTFRLSLDVFFLRTQSRSILNRARSSLRRVRKLNISWIVSWFNLNLIFLLMSISLHQWTLNQ
jgi:hypothetical protein